jgi:hypothetical protein
MIDAKKCSNLAEREGFEPSVAFRLRQISNLVPSTTRPPLRAADRCRNLHFNLIMVPCLGS